MLTGALSEALTEALWEVRRSIGMAGTLLKTTIFLAFLLAFLLGLALGGYGLVLVLLTTNEPLLKIVADPVNLTLYIPPEVTKALAGYSSYVLENPLLMPVVLFLGSLVLVLGLLIHWEESH